MDQLITRHTKENRMTYLEKLRKENPLVICITNDVVKNFTANGLLALGASPAMSEYQEDLEDMLPYAGGLLINIGTLNDVTWQLYKDALDIAEKNNVPTVLDPVAAGAGPFRKKVALDLLENHTISLLRGNSGEIAALIGEKVLAKGVDSSQSDNIGELALKANLKFKIPVVVTGEEDAIAVNGTVRILSNGSSLMPLVTGTGCLLGAVLAAFINLTEQENEIDCLEEVMSVYNIAGELAARNMKGDLPGTFQIEFLNNLHTITSSDVAKYKKVRSYE